MNKIRKTAHRGSKTPRKKLTLSLNADFYKFTEWFRLEGGNISKFTRELWKDTPEYKFFLANKEKRKNETGNLS